MSIGSPSTNNFDIYDSGRYYAGSDYSEQTTNHGPVYHHNFRSSTRRVYEAFNNHGQYIEQNNGQVNNYKRNQRIVRNSPEHIRDVRPSIRNPRVPPGPPYTSISQIPPTTPNEGLYIYEEIGFRPHHGHSAAQVINPPAIPKSTPNLEADLRRLPPNVLEYVRNLERQVDKQGSDYNKPFAPQNRDRPHLRMRHDVSPPPNCHDSPASMPPDHEPASDDDSDMTDKNKSHVASRKANRKISNHLADI